MTPVRPLPRRKGPMGRWEVRLPSGAWIDERSAEDAGIPLFEPLPVHAPSPVVVRREAPEVPTMIATEPAPAPVAPRAPAVATREPTERQRRAWEAYHRTGGQSAAGRDLGWSQAHVRSAVLGYMNAMGIDGPIPAPDVSLVPTRDALLAVADRVTAEAVAAGATHVPPASEVAPPLVERIVLTPEGHPWAADPEPIDETLAAPTSDQHLTHDAGPGHEMTAPVVDRRSDYSEAIPAGVTPSVERIARDLARMGYGPEVAGSTGGEPEPVALPAKGTPAPHHPRTGGGGRGDPDDFLGRLEHELDALAREDADLVAARTAVATRIERLRTAGEVYRAVMAGRAA